MAVAETNRTLGKHCLGSLKQNKCILYCSPGLVYVQYEFFLVNRHDYAL